MASPPAGGRPNAVLNLSKQALAKDDCAWVKTTDGARTATSEMAAKGSVRLMHSSAFTAGKPNRQRELSTPYRKTDPC